MKYSLMQTTWMKSRAHLEFVEFYMQYRPGFPFKWFASNCIPDYTYCWCLKSIFNIKYFSYEPPHKMRKPLFSSSNCWSFILIGSLLTCTVQSTQINRKTMLCHENYPNNLETNVLWSACFLYILSNFTIHLEIM